MNLKFLNFPVSTLFSSLLALISLSACVTPQYKRFDDVKVGMRKDQVLDATGSSPTRVQRVDSEDRWIYEMPKDGDFIVKEVHFRDEKSTYVGDPQPPAISAEQQDKINDETNARLDALDKANAEQIHEDTRRVLEGSDTPATSIKDDPPTKAPNWEVIQ